MEALTGSTSTLFSLPGAHVGVNETNFDLRIGGFLHIFIARGRARVKTNLGVAVARGLTKSGRF